MAEKKRRDGSKICEFKVRMSREEVEKLRFASEKLEISMSDVIRNGVSTQYNLAKFRSNND